ncbi:MAG: hypothetical protein ABIO50_07275 [Nitrosospira sp.]
MKRNIFTELVEGFDALAGEHAGKVRLRSHKIEMNKLPAVTASALPSDIPVATQAFGASSAS